MRRHHMVSQNIPLCQEFNRRTAILFLAILDFSQGFGQMSVQHVIFGNGHLGAALENLFAHRIDGMRHHSKLHAIIFIAMVLQELEILLDMFRGIQIFGNRHANRCSDSHFLHDLHSDFAMPVHIRKEDRSRLDHFKHGQAGSDFDILGGQFRLERPDVFLQPFLERHVIGISTQEGHGSMSVPVIERRYNGKPLAIHHFGLIIIASRKHTPHLSKLLSRDENILYFTLE